MKMLRRSNVNPNLSLVTVRTCVWLWLVLGIIETRLSKKTMHQKEVTGFYLQGQPLRITAGTLSAWSTGVRGSYNG